MNIRKTLFAACATLCIFPFETSPAGEHDCDAVGDAPEADFKFTGRFRYEDDVILIGVETEIDVSMTPKDKDLHQATPSDTPAPVDDTFDLPGAVEWSEDVGGGFADAGAKNTKFTAPEIEVGGHIFIKIKDDAIHAEDYDELTEMYSIDIKIVKPDGVEIVSQVPSFIAYQSPSLTIYPQMTTPVVWQATYGGLPLACRVWLIEKYQFAEHYADVLPGEYEFNRGGDWANDGDWASFDDRTNEDGKITDVHNSSAHQFAGANEYIDWGGAHYMGRKDSNSSAGEVLLATFRDREYAIGASTPAGMQGIHDEVP